MDEKTAIQGTLEDIRRAIKVIEEERDAIDARLSDAKARLTFWQTRLETADSQQTRRKKGQIIEALRIAFESIPNGATLKDLSEKTGIPPSSLRTTLMRAEAKLKAGVWSPPEGGFEAKDSDS